MFKTNDAVAVARHESGSYRMAAVQCGNDIARGVTAISKMVLTLLLGATVLLSLALVLNVGAREHAIKVLPTSVLAWASDRLQERTAAQVPVAQQGSAEAQLQAARKELIDEVQQRHVTQYLARRYRVAEEAMRALVAVAHESGAEAGVDPLLVLAVMAVESSMNPFAESSVGAQGLMQVMTRVHTEKFEPLGGNLAALDPVANIKVGTKILQDLIRRGGSVERGLHLYVGAGNQESDGGYGRRVLAEQGRLKLAAGGKVELALVYGVRPAQPEVKSATPINNVVPAELPAKGAAHEKSGKSA